MSAVSETKLPILDNRGQQRGLLCLFLLPGQKPSTLWDLREALHWETDLEPVQLMEGEEYRYEFQLPADAPTGTMIETDRPEVFHPDTWDGRSGRLRTQLYTGMLPVVVTCGTVELGRVALEVRSKKLDYLKHYRWMLGDIANHFAEAVMERFAPSEQRFRLDETRDAETLYQRFAFLKSLISGDEFEAAVSQILTHPHRAWVVETELRRPGQGTPTDSGIGRQIASFPGPRMGWPDGPVDHLPTRIPVRRTEETRDTPENRFVQFALSQWRDVAATIGRMLAEARETAPTARGVREVAAVIRRLDELLSAELFREVAPLDRFPSGSQVLQRQAGYREIYRAYIQFEAAAVLTWEGGADVFGAGQRNVAALYEYWVFLQISRAVAALCTHGFTVENLYARRPDGLSVLLQRGQQRLVTGTTERHGRCIRLELWFNRSFWHQKGPSWTVPMRPDCSLRIRPEPGTPASFEEIWLHFVAKYRIAELPDIFGDLPQPDGDQQAYLAMEHKAEDAGTARREDLLKMHAYRDAIRRSAGAYVIYPGQGDGPLFSMYHEILPGLGAFALRPTQGEEADGLAAIRAFLDEVLDHVASQATQHERGRYWVREAWDQRYRVATPVSAVPFLTRPPADTKVLLGYVRSPAHLQWIQRHLFYNLRADGRFGSVLPDSRELAAELVVLYGPTLEAVEIWQVQGSPEVMTQARMLELKYPNPGRAYYCLRLTAIPRQHWPQALSLERIRAVRDRIRPHAAPGLPLATTWFELMR